MFAVLILLQTWSVPFYFPFALHLLTVDPITPGPSMQEILHSASYNTSVVLVEIGRAHV